MLDESQARVVQGEAFQQALTEFCRGRGSRAARLLATYGARGLRRMVTGVVETLRSAGRPLELELPGESELPGRVEELRDAARCLLDEGARRRAARGLELLDAAPVRKPSRPLRLRRERPRAGAVRDLRRGARTAVERAALDELARRDRDLLQRLLQAFAKAYRAAKDNDSALDFEDLQLYARDLLVGNAEIRDRERWRLRSIMVDEFQDTNRLQCELVDLLAGEELFFVGDEFQSIYRFRHADVEVFRERREQTGGVLALTENYRSRPEVLEVINHLFSADFGTSFQPLSAAGRFPDPAFGPAVELLVTDKSTYSDTGVHWRKAEAQHVARRLREIVDAGEATPGEIVLLFAAGTDARLYEEELRALDLPTFRATGRDYYSRQQVVDLLAYLRLLQNRYDDEALVTVLASPFVGVSNDALVLLRRAAGRRPLYAGIERGLPEDMEERDVRLFRAFRQRYERLAEGASGLSLERLCEQVVIEHDYDLAVLAQADGRRRYANMRKLARLARSYEELRGRDIEGFVRFVREQDSVGATELEAVAEEEDTDVIRLLTIHAAKGLEFKVVVVADAGRDSRASRDEVLCLPDGRLGFKVAHPSTGKRLPTTGYEEVKEVEAEAERDERRRLYYVAMTRAIDRLIVSGSIDPSRASDAETPIGWVLERLGPEELERAGDAPLEIVRDDARLAPAGRPLPAVGTPASPRSRREDEEETSCRCSRPARPSPLRRGPAAARARAGACGAGTAYGVCPTARWRSSSAARTVSTPSGSRGCGRRGGPGEAASRRAGRHRGRRCRPRAARAGRPRGARRTGRLRRSCGPDIPSPPMRSWSASASWPAYAASELARRVAALPGAKAERPFAFEHDGVLFHGRIDVLHVGGGSRARHRLQDERAGRPRAGGRGRCGVTTSFVHHRQRARVFGRSFVPRAGPPQDYRP